MDPYRKSIKKFTKKFGSKVINRHIFSMKILSINNFTNKLPSKLLRDLSIGVHLIVFDTKKFGSKVNNRQYFSIKKVFL
jgi:hypothetical protein